VRVKHGLARCGAGVEDPAKLAAAFGVRDLLRNCGHLGEKLGRGRGKRGDVGLVPLWHHEHVNGRLGGDVAEGEDVLGLNHNVGRYLARDDAAEDAVRHEDSLGARVTTILDMAADTERPHKEWHELTAVILLSIVAVLTAWCGFESSKWGGEMSIAFSQASSNRVRASDAASASRDAFQLDATVFAQWLVAERAGDTEFSAYLETLFSPALQTAFDAWDHKTKTPFGLPEYVPAGTDVAKEFTEKADAAYATALVNNQRGDNYSLLTVMFALVLFLAAMSQRKAPEWAQRTLLIVATVVAVAGVVILATFPIKI